MRLAAENRLATGKDSITTQSNNADIIVVDNVSSAITEADEIWRFEDGSDRIDLDLEIVWWKAERTGQRTDTTLYSSNNADAGDNVLAIIRGLEATDAIFTNDDFVNQDIQVIEIL